MAKFGALFCVLLLAYGAQCSIIDNIRKDIESIMNTTKESIENMVATVQDSMNAIQNETANAADNISSSIKDVVSKYQQAVVSVANSTTTTIVACTEEAQEQFSAVAETVQAEATTCVTNVTDQLASHITDLTTKYTAVTDYIDEINLNATACQNIYADDPKMLTFVTATGCMTALTVEGGAGIAERMAELTDSVNSIVSYITNLRTQLRLCAASVAITAIAESLHAIYDTFELCVKESV